MRSRERGKPSCYRPRVRTGVPVFVVDLTHLPQPAVDDPTAETTHWECFALAANPVRGLCPSVVPGRSTSNVSAGLSEWGQPAGTGRGGMRTFIGGQAIAIMTGVRWRRGPGSPVAEDGLGHARACGHALSEAPGDTTVSLGVGPSPCAWGPRLRRHPPGPWPPALIWSSRTRSRLAAATLRRRGQRPLFSIPLYTMRVLGAATSSTTSPSRRRARKAAPTVVDLAGVEPVYRPYNAVHLRGPATDPEMGVQDEELAGGHFEAMGATASISHSLLYNMRGFTAAATTTTTTTIPGMNGRPARPPAHSSNRR